MQIARDGRFRDLLPDNSLQMSEATNNVELAIFFSCAGNASDGGCAWAALDAGG
jgi:hypothetical protein